MFSQLDYAMVIVSDMEKSTAFYRDKVGLQLKFQSPGWTEFSTGTTTLALHPGGPAQAGAGPEPRAGTCSIGFTVPDVDKAYEELKGRGVTFSMPPTDSPQEGIRIAVCVDPDGLPISIAQMLQPAAE